MRAAISYLWSRLGSALCVLRDATLRVAPQDEENLYAKKILLILRRPAGPSRRTHHAAASLLLLAAMAVPAQAVTPTDPLIGQNGDVFQLVDDGIRHQQSRVVCPRSLKGFPITRLIVYPGMKSKGSDVSCGYGNYPAGAVTLYMVRPSDSAKPVGYRDYSDAARMEVLRAHPAAGVVRPPAAPSLVSIDGITRSPSIDAWTFPDRKQKLYSLLYLSDANPWIIMVRASGPTGIKTRLWAAGSDAWLAAARTIGQ